MLMKKRNPLSKTNHNFHYNYKYPELPLTRENEGMKCKISSFLVGDSWVSGAVVNLLSNNETSSGPFSGGTYNGSNLRFNNKSQSIAANQLCS